MSESAINQMVLEYAKAVSKRPSLRKREKDASVEEFDASESLGYETFKRGDMVEWCPNVHAQEEAEDDIFEVVYGCAVLKHRGQQRRYLITYAETLNQFSVNAWSSWKRVPVSSAGRAFHKLSSLLVCAYSRTTWCFIITFHSNIYCPSTQKT